MVHGPQSIAPCCNEVPSSCVGAKRICQMSVLGPHVIMASTTFDPYQADCIVSIIGDRTQLRALWGDGLGLLLVSR